MIWRESLADLIGFEIGAQCNLMFDAGSTIEFFTGTMPASIDDADAGTLLVTIPLNDPPFDAAEEGPRRVDMDVTGMAATSVGAGTVTYWRMKTNAGAVQCQGTAGSGSVDFVMTPNDTVASGRTITVLSFRLLLDLSPFEE